MARSGIEVCENVRGLMEYGGRARSEEAGREPGDPGGD